MDVKVEFRGERLAEAAVTLTQVFETLLARILERDADLELSALRRIIVAEDYAGELQRLCGEVAGQGVVRAIHDTASVALLVDGVHLGAALAGEAEQVAALVHLFHRELCRIHDARARLGQSASLQELLGCDFDRQLLPIAESMWAEYFSTRRAVWSLPGGSDLMLSHLADLVEVLPQAIGEEILLHLGGEDLDGLFAQSCGRVTHLLQTMAHCQGYLAGLDRGLAEVAPEYDEMLRASLLGPLWNPVARRLARLFEAPALDTEAIYLSLQPDILGAFAALGLSLRRAEDGAVWLDARPPAGLAPLQ